MAKKKKEEFSYRKALAEIEQIAQQVEEGMDDVDELTQKLERAKNLIEQCEKMLREGETKVKKIFSDEG